MQLQLHQRIVQQIARVKAQQQQLLLPQLPLLPPQQLNLRLPIRVAIPVAHQQRVPRE